jgi:hypothetical protein
MAAVWVQVASAGPGARAGHALAYDVQRRRTVLMGGTSGPEPLGETWEYVGFPGAAAVFGSGCGNPPLMLSPVAASRPVINATGQALLTNVPSAVAFVAIGLSTTSLGAFPLPLALAGFGVPGCALLHSAEVAAQPVTFTGPGAAVFALQLPNQPGLIGLCIYLQAWAFAPSANPGHTVVSNGLEWMIGDS